MQYSQWLATRCGYVLELQELDGGSEVVVVGLFRSVDPELTV
jgi:hypothetical protein